MRRRRGEWFLPATWPCLCTCKRRGLQFDPKQGDGLVVRKRQQVMEEGLCLRQLQYAARVDSAGTLMLGRRFVEAKMRNCRTLLRRDGKEVQLVALKLLSELAERVRQVDDPG